MDCKQAILSNDVYDYITDFPISNLDNASGAICYQNIDDYYHILHLDRMRVPNLEVNFFEYQSIPKVYGLMQENTGLDVSNLYVSGITQMQRSTLNLTGRGTVICIIDTGIDYRNPAFLDEEGKSRILAIWDQTIQEGIPPEGFLYGTEYKRDEINRALQAQNPYTIVPTVDDNGHGSAMAGVAAGRNLSDNNPYLGAAPQADIVVVKLKECKPYLRDFYLIPDNVPAYQENDIMQAVNYGSSFAILSKRPVVICLGLGTNMGDHAGSSALSRYLDEIALRQNRAVVVCGGNEGEAAHHYQGDFHNADNIEVGRIGIGTRQAGLYQDVEIRVAEGAKGFFLEIWGSMPDTFNISVISPGGEAITPTRLGIPQSITYGFVYEKSTVTIDTTLVEPSSGEELILIRVVEPTPGIWTIRVLTSDVVSSGVFHMWLPISQFLSAPVYFLSPSPYITLTEPAMASEVISVSTYNGANNSFYINSGRGFSRTGLVRPDISAPGVNIATIFGRNTGSSYASAITAGAVAQFMQWAVVQGNMQFVNSRAIKSNLIRGAQRSNDIIYPNREWGYGRLNIEGTFNAMRGV